ncbi:MAG TPA: hypothetical protein VHQ64_14750, partial [Pyrinomonadaceae bacterium]|nr:hypothetical protein [Pyrinomonadaceae bacterium]
PWLMLMALGSFLLAIGLLTIPHDESFKEIFGKLGGGFAAAKQAFVGSILVIAGIAAAAVGAVIGMVQRKTS